MHLESGEDVTAFLHNCKRLLLPGGCLILQIVNYDRILRHKQTELPLITVPDKHLMLVRKYVLSPESVQFMTELQCDAEHWASETRLLALKQGDLEKSLGNAGFKDIKFYGDFEKNPWNTESPATIAVVHL